MRHRLGYWVSKILRLAAKELTTPLLADEYSIAYLHFAAHGHQGRSAVDGKAFESVVVVVGVLRRDGDNVPR
jgi:hypothetical protein